MLKETQACCCKGSGVVRPILTSEYGSRAQVDLIDMQSMPNGQHKWIMVYQDHLTKYCVLRPLTTKRAAEVAYHLMDIFLLLGAPHILQSDNGAEFTVSVITELKQPGPELLIVHGKPRHPQSQGSVERLNCDVKDMLIAWLADNNSTDWPVGLKFVQFSKNTSYHSGIKQTPYKALFGVDPRVGLRSTALPTEVLERMVTEDDLFAAFQAEDAATTTDVIATSSTAPADAATTTEMIATSSTAADTATTIEVIATSSTAPADAATITDVMTVTEKVMTVDHVCLDKEVSLRTAVQMESKCGGQGFVKCNCSGNCQLNRCKCFKAHLKCNSSDISIN